ncbi:MAG: hypothetical protein CL728_04875 [Chloroflexi bacterium]|nr:hypothetical protein [Chloroflexota bacterium]
MVAKIPKIYHVVWIGNPIPEIKQKWFLKNVEYLTKQGWSVMFWGNDLLTEENFPVTWKYIQKFKSRKPVVWAFIKDLMSYEIIYKYGGFFLDINFEVQKDLSELVDKAYKAGKTVLACNELECGLNCRGFDNKKFISNGFFAATPKNPIFKYSLKTKRFDSLDFTAEDMTRTPGPYYWRKSLSHNINSVLLLPTILIYPFHWFDIMKQNKHKFLESKNRCLVKKPTQNSNIPVKLPLKHSNQQNRFYKYPCNDFAKTSYLVNHFDLGATWQ